MTLNDLEPQKYGFKWFLCYFRLRRTLTVHEFSLKYTGDRPRLPKYEIKLMLWRVSWALAQISCYLGHVKNSQCNVMTVACNALPSFSALLRLIGTSCNVHNATTRPYELPTLTKILLTWKQPQLSNFSRRRCCRLVHELHGFSVRVLSLTGKASCRFAAEVYNNFLLGSWPTLQKISLKSV